MANTGTQVAPGNGKTTVQMEVPEGMTPEQYKKVIDTWNKNREKGQKIARADGQALRALIKAHKPEFHQLRVKFWREEGLDPSNLKQPK